MEIIEYTNKYRKQTIDLLIDIAVNEYGFSSWKEDLLTFKNEFFKDNGGNCWIALEDDTVVGTISLRNIDNICGEVKNLYIIKEKRGTSSLGQDLLNTLLSFAKQHNYSKLKLDAYRQFERSIKFYERNGFNLTDSNDVHFTYEKDLTIDYIYT